MVQSDPEAHPPTIGGYRIRAPDRDWSLENYGDVGTVLSREAAGALIYGHVLNKISSQHEVAREAVGTVYRSIADARYAEMRERIDETLSRTVSFITAIEAATAYMSAAFERAGVSDFHVPKLNVQSAPKYSQNEWRNQSFRRAWLAFKQLRNALVHAWTPNAEAEPLEQLAFLSLCRLSPAKDELWELRSVDRALASSELLRELDLVASHVAHMVELRAKLEGSGQEADPNSTTQIRKLQKEILRESGEQLTLAEAAQRLKVSKQALHKRIQSGTALGVMYEQKLIVPAVQFVETDKGLKVVDKLKPVLATFDAVSAGRWDALQFLVSHDPNLDARPIDALKEGHSEAATHAARAYLGLDEE